jgi:hypothetical protein
VHRLLQERIPDIRTFAPRHEIAARGMQKLDAWDEYYKFAFVRNPWDRLVSWYSMVTTPQKIPKTGNELWRYARENSSTFEEFIYNCTDEVEVTKGVTYSFAYNQLDYVTDEQGNFLVDFIGQLETFDNDVQEVFDRIGVELETIPHRNRSDHRHYSTFYKPDTEMIVRERFKRDIEYFGYEFERPHNAASTEKVAMNPRQGAQRKIEVGVTTGPRVTAAKTRPGRIPKDEPLSKPRPLFVCGCDTTGTATLAAYLNRHPAIALCQKASKTTEHAEITLDLSNFARMLDFRQQRPKDSISEGGGDGLMQHHGESLANKEMTRLRWIGVHSSDCMRNMESIAGNNPGARFIVMYRPIEEVVESWETKDANNQLSGDDRFEQGLKAWNRSLQGTRRFMRDSLVPRVLLISYHDFLHRTEIVVPLISRFLDLEFDESVAAEWADEALQSEKGKQRVTLSSEERSLIDKHANRSAEAWILERIDKQYKKPALYIQKTTRAALATSLDELEAKTWRLQRKVRDLERDRERRRQRFKQLKNSRTWKMVNMVSSIRTKMVGR